jgi:hypothetical protein
MPRFKKLYGSGGSVPHERAFYLAAIKSYDAKAPKAIDGFNLVMDRPTIDAYVNIPQRMVLIGVRGTDPLSADDLKADAMLAINNLRNSQRYRRDKSHFDEVVKKYPPSSYRYFVAGHSLGQAILLQLKRDYPFIEYGVGYNGAFQPQDLVGQQDNEVKHIYSDGDPLYKSGGRLFRRIQVIPTKKDDDFFDRLRKTLIGEASLFGRFAKTVSDGLKGHSMDQFKTLYGMGGRRMATPEEIARGDFYEKPYADGSVKRFYQDKSSKGTLNPVSGNMIIRGDPMSDPFWSQHRRVDDEFGGYSGWRNRERGSILGPLLKVLNDPSQTPEVIRATMLSLLDYFTKFYVADETPATSGQYDDFKLAFNYIKDDNLRSTLLQVLDQYRDEGYVGTFWAERIAQKEEQRQKQLAEAQEKWRQEHPFDAFVLGITTGIADWANKLLVRPITNVVGTVVGLIDQKAGASVKGLADQFAGLTRPFEAFADPTTSNVISSIAEEGTKLLPVTGALQALSTASDVADVVGFVSGQGKRIDFEDISQGSFTKQFQAFKQQNPRTRIKTLEQYAKHVLAKSNSKKFKEVTKRRARFYLNILAKKSKK